MAASIAVEIEGLSQMIAAFDKSPALFVQVFDEAVKKSTYVLLGKAREFTPVDKNFLRGTMDTTFATLVGQIDSKAPYDIYVHEGTGKMEARPFYDNAINAEQDQVNQIFDSAFEKFNNSL